MLAFISLVANLLLATMEMNECLEQNFQLISILTKRLLQEQQETNNFLEFQLTLFYETSNSI